MKRDVTTPEEKDGAGITGPPVKHTVPSPKDLSHCKGCPYPGVGFICWSPDGSCLKTDLNRMYSSRKGR